MMDLQSNKKAVEVMDIPHLQSIIRRNSTEIQELETSVQEFWADLDLKTISLKRRRFYISPTKKKIARLAKLQVILKKEISSLMAYNRLYGPYQ